MADRDGVFVCVGLPVLCSYSPGWSPIITRGCGCRGSTTLAQHAQYSLCSFYSRQPTDSLLPNNVFKAVFFTVWCLFSVPVARAAVNRLLESCCFVFVFFLIFICVSQFVSSAPGAILCSVSVTNRCVYCQLSSVSAISEVNVIVTVFKWQPRDDKNVKKHVFRMVDPCSMFSVCQCTLCCVWDAGQPGLANEWLLMKKENEFHTDETNVEMYNRRGHTRT